MAANPELIRTMGSEPPILAGGRRAPDRRDISLRWLSGTFLTGITSGVLMGVALFAALDGREQLAIPGEALAAIETSPAGSGEAEKGGRLVPPVVATKPADRTIMEVSTVVHDGDHDVVRREPFAHVKMSLAANHATQQSYPNFDPLAILSNGKTDPAPAEPMAAIYGAQVDSQVSLKTVDFPLDARTPVEPATLSLDQVEHMVRADAGAFTGATVQVASLYTAPPKPTATTVSPKLDFDAGLNARVTTENVSIAPMKALDPSDVEFGDDIIAFRTSESIASALTSAGYDSQQAEEVEGALEGLIDASALDQGDVLRLGLAQTGTTARIVRASVYSGSRHVATVARNDKGSFVIGAKPPDSEAVATAFDDTPVPTLIRRDLPDLYDGLYQAGLSYGMSQAMIAHIVKLLASSVDFKAAMKPTDSLEAFFSDPDKSGKATEQSQLLYVDAHIDDKDIRFYRFQNPKTGTVDYYGPEGKSIRPFLLRNPVPNGIFTSPFGMRRHPILGYKRMHWGCDWAAPRGTPVLSVGDGIVVKASWDSGGYGNQTIVRYPNGYESLYNHQSAFAKGIVPGAHVHQGQVIGYVGSTGLATGPHMHYEVEVNGTKVDPMKVRFPDRDPLDGAALAAFEHERKRIDSLLADKGGSDDKVASR